MSDSEEPFPGTLPPDVPEADALEQAQEVAPMPPPRTGPPAYEAPEADAWEQAQEVPVDDDRR
jgi:hypothetical protein